MNCFKQILDNYDRIEILIDSIKYENKKYIDDTVPNMIHRIYTYLSPFLTMIYRHNIPNIKDYDKWI